MGAPPGYRLSTALQSARLPTLLFLFRSLRRPLRRRLRPSRICSPVPASSTRSRELGTVLESILISRHLTIPSTTRGALIRGRPPTQAVPRQKTVPESSVSTNSRWHRYRCRLGAAASPTPQ